MAVKPALTSIDHHGNHAGLCFFSSRDLVDSLSKRLDWTLASETALFCNKII